MESELTRENMLIYTKRLELAAGIKPTKHNLCMLKAICESR